MNQVDTFTPKLFFFTIVGVMLACAAGLFVNTAEAQSLSGSGGAHDTFAVSWQHDIDGAGPMQPIDVDVQTKLREGETVADAVLRFRMMVEEMSAAFPPNVGPESP